jgi:hypothetical protein
MIEILNIWDPATDGVIAMRLPKFQGRKLLKALME